MVAAGVADEMLVRTDMQLVWHNLQYLSTDTYGRSNVKMSDGEIAEKIKQMFDLRQRRQNAYLNCVSLFTLKQLLTATWEGKNETVTKTFTSRYHETKTVEVELFTWEKLDRVDEIKKAFNI